MQKVFYALLGLILLSPGFFGIGGCGGGGCGEFADDTGRSLRICDNSCGLGLSSPTLLQQGCSLEFKNLITEGDLAADLESTGNVILEPITDLDSGDRWECEGLFYSQFGNGDIATDGRFRCNSENGSQCSFYLAQANFGCP